MVNNVPALRTPQSMLRWHRSLSRALVTSGGIVLIDLGCPIRARADAPLNYMVTEGSRAQSIEHLAWFTSIVSILVIVIVTGLLLAGIFRRRDQPAPTLPNSAPVERTSSGLSWIYYGVGISTIVLFVTMVWTFFTLSATANPPPGPAAATVEVTGHQWWWEVRYVSDDSSQEFVTANEIHIPMGKVVNVTLHAADVIHSFWVPQLAGKTDLIPGQENRTWIEALRPGIYRGQCGEYCGEQHAHMGFNVIASSPAEFEEWRRQQLQSAASAAVGQAKAGQDLFTTRCGICHTVRGTLAGGNLGPDLTHVMSRSTIGAAALPNNPASLAAWIADPQHIKPGNFMPRLDLSGPEMALVRQYVESLK
jgi:cytochrome c oxidase subunit 2